jgi:hypothetical protein
MIIRRALGFGDRPALKAHKTKCVRVYGRFRRVILILGLCSLVFGCGYHFRSVGSSLDVHLESLAIPPFSGASSYARIEDDFTTVVRQEFLTRSKVRLVEEKSAQAVLRGHLYSVTTEPLTYTVTQQKIHGLLTTDTVTRSRTLKVRLEISLKDTATEEIIWQDANLTDTASFQVSSDPLTTQHNQRLALIAIARDLAAQIYSRTMERF